MARLKIPAGSPGEWRHPNTITGPALSTVKNAKVNWNPARFDRTQGLIRSFIQNIQGSTAKRLLPKTLVLFNRIPEAKEPFLELEYETGEKSVLQFSSYKTPTELYEDLKRRRDEIGSKEDIISHFTLHEEADEADLAAEKKKKKEAAAKKGAAPAKAGGKGGAKGGAGGKKK